MDERDDADANRWKLEKDSGTADEAEPRPKTRHPWSHPGVWAFLAFAYCTPGVFVVWALPVDVFAAYIQGTAVLLIVGTVVVWRKRNWRAALGAFVLMVIAVAVGLFINAEIVCSSGC